MSVKFERTAIFVALTSLGALLLSQVPGLSLSSIGLGESGFFRAMILNTDYECFRIAFVASVTLGAPLLIYWFCTSLEWHYKVMTIRADLLRTLGALILVGVVAMVFLWPTPVEGELNWRMKLLLASRSDLGLFCFYVYAWTAALSFAVSAGLRNIQHAYIQLVAKFENTNSVRRR
jgi:hypothetical protein